MDAYDFDEGGDPRDVELGALAAIFPELQIDENDRYAFSYEVPVHPSKIVTVSFPAPADGPVNTSALTREDIPENHTDSHGLSYLPSVRLDISLPVGYPEKKAPVFAVSASPPWLPATVTARLKDDGPRLWEDLGRDMVVFTYIDHVVQAADEVFHLVDEKGSLEVGSQHKIAILDYDIRAKRAAFDKGTYECGVCLDPKKGANCHRMMECGHVFCKRCLQDYYNGAITEGDLASVRCPAPNCSEQRAKSSSGGKRGRKPNVFVSPGELLQIPLAEDVVKRYVALRYKTELESDKKTVYCPRPWCNGAARSKKHKKPEGFEMQEVADESDSEADDEGSADSGTPTKIQNRQDFLAVCEDCDFAFCSRCEQSWHGEFVNCRRRDKGDMSAEEKASLDYLRLYSTACPTCVAPAQKTHGCNHMICFRCQTHFCYLCSSWLDPENPYEHFNKTAAGRATQCFMRLWELEEGDGRDVDVGLHHPVDNEPPPRPAQGQDDGVRAGRRQPRHIPVIEEPDDHIGHNERVEARAREQAAVDADPANDGQIGVAREGPLVLRIAAPPARRPPLPPAPVPPPPAQAGRDGRRGGRGGRAGARGGVHGRNQQGHWRVVAPAAGDVPRIAARGAVAAPPVALGEADQAWIRNFVQHALNDDEDLVEWDSSEDDEEIVFWRDDDDDDGGGGGDDNMFRRQ